VTTLRRACSHETPAASSASGGDERQLVAAQAGERPAAFAVAVAYEPAARDRLGSRRRRPVPPRPARAGSRPPSLRRLRCRRGGRCRDANRGARRPAAVDRACQRPSTGPDGEPYISTARSPVRAIQ
jgi:hypothetical protein